MDFFSKYSVFGHQNAEPVGLQYISKVLASYPYKVNHISHWELEITIPDNNCNISLFSAISTDWLSVIKLNQKAKSRGNITIVGGYHVTGLYRAGYDLNDLPFDYFVVGEGEQIIKKVISEILNRTSNNIWPASPKVFISDIIENIDILPFQKRYIKFLEEYKIQDLMCPSISFQKNTAIVLGSRGCGHNCSFCASSSMWGSKVRLRNPENIIEEIKQLKEEFQTNTIIFIDQCFGVNMKWAEELCQRIIKEKIGVNWYIQTSVNIKPKLIPLMAAAGCSKMGFGVESLSKATLTNIKPGHSKSLEVINGLLRYCNKNGILTKAYLMLGFPWETKEYMETYLHNIRTLEANCIKISFFTPFPGTQDWELYKNQLVSTDWSDFDTVKLPVVRNPYISVDEYLGYREMLFHSFYSSQQYKLVTMNLLNNYPKFTQSFLEFYKFLRHYRMLPVNTELNEWLPLTQNTLA